jgi:uroporphyrinogen-III decarboxylase
VADQKDVSFFSVDSVEGVELDPADPRTWCIVQNRDKPDWIDVTAQMHDHAMTLGGTPARKFYYDATAHVNTMVAVAAYYGFDSGRGSFDVYNIEAEAMGQRMIYAENAMPTVDFRDLLIKRPEDLLKLRPPDWRSAGRVPFALDVIKLNAAMGLNRGYFCAPFSLAVALRSYPKLIRDMRKNPEFAHDLFTFLVDEILPSYLSVQKDYCGITMGLGSDAWAAFPNLSPELLEEWVVPYVVRLRDNLQDFGMSAMVVAGADYCEERVERFNKDILFQCFDIQIKIAGPTPIIFLGMGRWHDYPLEPVIEYLAPYKDKGVRMDISVGVNARLLRDGPVERIVAYIKRMIDLLGRDHNISFWLANIPADTPSEHIHAAVAAVHTYGRRPIAEDLDTVELHIPERESFREYVEKISGGIGLGIDRDTVVQ